jgi:hypothetical protein
MNEWVLELFKGSQNESSYQSSQIKFFIPKSCEQFLKFSQRA